MINVASKDMDSEQYNIFYHPGDDHGGLGFFIIVAFDFLIMVGFIIGGS